MRTYKVKTHVRKFDKTDSEFIEEIFILSVKDNLDEFIQMAYGCWYDVIEYQSEEIRNPAISKTYLIEQAKELVRFGTY